MAAEPVVSLLRIRVVKIFTAGNAEVTSDLAHLHEVHIDVAAMQPGNPSSSALGAFRVRLHPPGSPGYAANRAVYDNLDYFQRLEFYISHDAASLGKLYFAGIVTEINKVWGEGATFELAGHSDLVLAHLSRPFPGELTNNQITSSMIKSYMGTNELVIGDNFNPFTAGNFTSTNIPAHTSGIWSSDTDDNMTVVKCSTGTGAALISKTGSTTKDGPMNIFAECTGRLAPSADTANAGAVGIGMTQSSADCSNSVLAYATAVKGTGGRYFLNVTLVIYSAGNVSNIFQSTAPLLNVDEPDAKIPITIGLLMNEGGNATGTPVANVTVNGTPIPGLVQFPTGYVPGSNTWYPFLFYSTPASGTATGYLTNLVEMVRVSADGGTAAVFAVGNISVSTHSLPWGIDPGPNFLDTWTRCATREGWYWRYTPQPYVIGSRTLGKVDFAADPGADLTKSIIFSEGAGNLVSLRLSANADAPATDTMVIGQSTLDGGGLSFFRDIATMQKYGVIQDEMLAFTHGNFSTLRRASGSIIANKTTFGLNGAKVGVFKREADTADAWRELDRVAVDNPEQGINRLSVRVIGYGFDEGQANQPASLDQFSAGE